MIRCVYCDRLVTKQIQHKTFFHCRECPEKLWDKLRNTHPRWCPKVKEAKQRDQMATVSADGAAEGTVQKLPGCGGL